jgi:16S rRNA (cytosine967-C5)-methyltransferase
MLIRSAERALSPSDAAAGARVRARAAECISQVVVQGRSLEDVLGEAVAADEPGNRDLALLRALVSGALRWHHRLAWQAHALLHRPLPAREQQVAALLRVGLFQLQFMRVPEHAAVATTVDATGVLGLSQFRGLVNAVLRRFLRERSRLDTAMQAVPEALHSHPQWLLAALERDWSAAWRDIVQANNAPPPMWLRVNLARGSRADYLERLERAGVAAMPSARVASALLLEHAQPMASLPGFAEGLVSVQDAAAQMAAGLLDLAPGLRVLDACAAPGGKTAHMLESCGELAELVALDRDAARLATLQANLARLGLSATIQCSDAAEPEAWWDGRLFDRILLDAPCSAVGVIRRHPDIKVLRRASDVPESVASQARMLHALWPLLVPGGRLVYATCSLLRTENQGQIARFLESQADAVRVPAGDDGEVQTIPGEANMDGFYYACLAKKHTNRV